MACNIIYDFIKGARIQLPTVSSDATAAKEDGRLGVRAILNPNDEAQALLDDHIRVLSELGRAASDS